MNLVDLQRILLVSMAYIVLMLISTQINFSKLFGRKTGPKVFNSIFGPPLIIIVGVIAVFLGILMTSPLILVLYGNPIAAIEVFIFFMYIGATVGILAQEKDASIAMIFWPTATVVAGIGVSYIGLIMCSPIWIWKLIQ